MRLLMLGLLFLTSGLAAAQPVHDTGRTGPRAPEGLLRKLSASTSTPEGRFHEAIEASHLLIRPAQRPGGIRQANGDPDSKRFG